MSTETITTQVELPEAPAKIESTWTSFVPMILIFAVFYFFLIRPQEKRRKEQDALINSVKKGEEVVTSGGIFGKVVKVNESESTVLVEISENNTVKLAKSAIVEIIGRTAAPVEAVKTVEKAPLETKVSKALLAKSKPVVKKGKK